MSQPGNNWPYVINLSNSIIGISALAMPFCFQQCGILLGIVILLFSTWLTIVSCQILMKAGITSRRSSYGFLAYYTYGVSGKMAVELGMIGLQIGTMIAQIVVIGDFGPDVLSKIFGIQNSTNLRTGLIMFMCLCVGLPLGLLKDLRVVSRASTICVCFYVVFIIYVLALSTPHLFSGNWYPKVYFWKTEGVFETLSIFAYSFGCQTQLFILYDALPEPSLKTVNGITSSAVNLCAVAYLLMGFFGYIAFHESNITADIIKLFPETFFADLMKFGFVVSIAITIPLIIFPCRVSLYNLLFSQTHHTGKGHDDVPAQTHIPEIHFKILTFFIVLGPMIVAILVPNVEFILSFNGATMGTLMCFVFPAVFFLKVNKGESKGVAQIVLICGITIMIISTFTILNPHKGHGHHEVKDTVADIVDKLDIPEKKADVKASKDVDDKRIEPVNPQAPDEKLKEIDKLGNKKMETKEKKKDEEVEQEKEEVVHDGDNKNKRDTGILEEKLKEKEKQIQETELKQKDLLNKLEKQQQESKKILEAQKEIMEELKDHKKEHVDSKVVGLQGAADQLNPQAPAQAAVGQAGLESPHGLDNGPQGLPLQNIHNNLNGKPKGPISLENKVPNNLENNVGNIPLKNIQGQGNIAQGNVFQEPVQNNQGQIPVQNIQGQIPGQNNQGQIPVQNNQGQIPVQNIQGQVPVQNYQVPAQNHQGQVPSINNQGLPNNNNLGNIPVESNKVPVQNNMGQDPPLNNIGNNLQQGTVNKNQAPVQNLVGIQNNPVPVNNMLDPQAQQAVNIAVEQKINRAEVLGLANNVQANDGEVGKHQGFVPNKDGRSRTKRDAHGQEIVKMVQDKDYRHKENKAIENIPVDGHKSPIISLLEEGMKSDEIRQKLRNMDNHNVHSLLSRTLLSEKEPKYPNSRLQT